MPRHFGKHWDEFKKIVSVDTPPDEVADFAKAFYAGGLALYYELLGAMVDGGDTPTPHAVRHMHEIATELEEYVQQLNRG